MNIAVLGCGGVGGYYGGRLAKHYSKDPNVKISFIARGKHLEAIRAHGLKVITPTEEFIAFPEIATDNASSLGVVDVLLVCVKTYDIVSSIQQIRSNVGNETVIIPLVNGIEPFEMLKKEFPSSRVFQGCCYLNSFVESPGVIKFRGGFEQAQIGFPDDQLREKISSLLAASGIDIYSAPEISEKVWEKFLFVSVLSGIGSLKNESFGDIVASAERMQLAREMMNELLLIAIAKGIKLPDTIVDMHLSKLPAYPKEARTSMQRDFTEGKRTEIETAIGYVIRCAKELKMDVPTYERVYSELNSGLAR
jgi:2-dehydropantoate 2-reductase